MGKRIAKRLAIALFTMYAVITISFLMVRFMPGDPLIHLVGQENYYVEGFSGRAGVDCTEIRS